jgi:competence protein ComEA
LSHLGKWLIETFGFKNREVKSFLVFTSLVLALFFTSLLPFEIIRAENFHPELEIKFSSYDLAPEKIAESTANHIPEEKDPNKMDYYDWRFYGLDFKLINRIISYRLNGGYFNKVEDLRKIYGLNDSIFNSLQNLKVSSSKRKKNNHFQAYENPNKEEEKKQIKTVSINFCDSIDLQKIPQIGPVRASRIIRFREILGGFHSKSQYSQIFGLDSLSLLSLKNHTELDLSKIRKININSSEINDLSKHPYLNKKLSKIIVNYRNQHGSFKNVEDLRKIRIIDSIKIADIRPYIRFD